MRESLAQWWEDSDRKPEIGRGFVDDGIVRVRGSKTLQRETSRRGHGVTRRNGVGRQGTRAPVAGARAGVGQHGSAGVGRQGARGWLGVAARAAERGSNGSGGGRQQQWWQVGMRRR